MNAKALTSVVLVCTGCHHWSCDFPPRAVKDLGVQGVLYAVATLHTEDHDCPGEGGRIKISGQWVDRPAMSDGRVPDAVLGAYPLPRWWVWS